MRFFSPKRPIFPHACAKCSELPSIVHVPWCRQGKDNKVSAWFLDGQLSIMQWFLRRNNNMDLGLLYKIVAFLDTKKYNRNIIEKLEQNSRKKELNSRKMYKTYTAPGWGGGAVAPLVAAPEYNTYISLCIDKKRWSYWIMPIKLSLYRIIPLLRHVNLIIQEVEEQNNFL